MITLRKLGITAAATVVATCSIALSVAAPAHADTDDDAIDRMAVTADLQSDGSAEVALDFDFDFGDDSGHGPYLSLPERMQIPEDPDKWRSLPITEVTATSTTAPDQVELDRGGGALLIRIGDEDQEIDGVHTYRVTYTIDGVVSPDAAGSGLDELSWNAIGTGWEIPLRDVSVTLRTPAEVERAACFSGADYTTPCAEQMLSTREVRYEAPAELAPGEGLQIVAGMPAGSFPGYQPIFTERWTLGRVLGIGPRTGALAAVVALLGSALAVVRLRRHGDREYADVTPGLVPVDRADSPTQPYRNQQIAVRFTPPDNVQPGEVRVLSHNSADQLAVSATIVDLAVRGHLVIEHRSEDKKDWRLVATAKSRDGLLVYESGLLNTLFGAASGEKSAVALDKPGVLEKASSTCKQGLAKQVAANGWYQPKAKQVRGRWVGGGAATMVAGLGAVQALGFTLGIGILGVALFVVGLVVMIMGFAMTLRSADGTATRIQSEGFRTYLATAEAGQIRVEEGDDIFSRYLPWAMIWGLTERWSKIFAELAARGAPLAVPAWYVGTTPWSFANASSVASTVSGFSAASTSAMTSATSGSGDGSGFTGGGGVGGGGGGGW